VDATSLTLGAFFARRYLPTYLAGASERTIVEYRTSLAKWAELTGDRPLDAITVEDLAAFKTKLLELHGRRAATLAAATANKHLRHIHGVLGKAGPAGPRNRDALGLIAAAPWVRPLKAPVRAPRSIPLETLGRIYAAADVATLPAGLEVRACTWWRSLIACAYNLGFRRGAWLRVESQHIDWTGHLVTVPAELDKCGRDRRKPANDVAMRHLLRVRTAQRRLFPWPHAGISFDRQWRRLQLAAGVRAPDLYKFHDLKRTCGTQLAPIASPWQVRYMLDHAQPDVSGLYVDPLPDLRRVVEAMPQPTAFSEDFSGQLRLFA
jgi:integrase